jgi:hypothetical protein
MLVNSSIRHNPRHDSRYVNPQFVVLERELSTSDNDAWLLIAGFFGLLLFATVICKLLGISLLDIMMEVGRERKEKETRLVEQQRLEDLRSNQVPAQTVVIICNHATEDRSNVCRVNHRCNAPVSVLKKRVRFQCD